MIRNTSNGGLPRISKFLETYGTERLGGFDASYFVGLNEHERREAWDLLVLDFAVSGDRITGLYLLDPGRAVPLFKAAVKTLTSPSLYPAERNAFERNQLSMFTYIYILERDVAYLDAICRFARSEFADVRRDFAHAAQNRTLSATVVEALKEMVISETERGPLAAAVTSLMSAHGMDFDRQDPAYKDMYLELRSPDQNRKIAAMNLLELMRKPDCA